MNDRPLDVLFVNPSDQNKIYQDLSKDYSAIETPTWCLLLAESCRSVGYKVAILDTCAERMDDECSLERINLGRPKLICFVVYGQNPNSGTTSMSGAVRLANFLKRKGVTAPISMVGTHIQSLPIQTLQDEPSLDFGFTNEGVYALWNVLALDQIVPSTIRDVNGLVFRDHDGKIKMTPSERVVPQGRMDKDLPGYAWDLLPFKETPLDLYRSHFWHSEYNHDKRSPFASIYTSLGCQFKCSFCMINIINRNDEDEIGVASNYAGMRFWSPEFIIKEFDKLYNMGVRTLRIADEMFLLNKKYYIPLCNLLKERGYGKEFNMWAYSRIDTIKKPENLKLIREAGIRWLCLGIESADTKVRLEVTKGKFKDIDIRKVVEMVHEADIEIIANYMVGLPGDTYETMQKTLDLSIELNTVAWNMYAAMALPGSLLYKQAVENGTALPESYAGYSFLSYHTVPLPTDSLSAAEILKFRDYCWGAYHNRDEFHDLIKSKFGKIASDNIKDLAKINMKRKILE